MRICSNKKRGENMEKRTAPIEIERKWLVDGWPEGMDAQLVFEQKMCQGYISVHPTVRIREEETIQSNRPEQPLNREFILCFKSAGRLARKEVELSITPAKYRELEDLIGEPLIRKIRRTYELVNGLRLEVNHVDAGLATEFWYAEIEFDSLAASYAFAPSLVGLGRYLVNDVTNQPGQSMGEYWEMTRLSKSGK